MPVDEPLLRVLFVDDDVAVPDVLRLALELAIGTEGAFGGAPREWIVRELEPATIRALCLRHSTRGIPLVLPAVAVGFDLLHDVAEHVVFEARAVRLLE